ncbi:MAG: MSMEG_4193 family putative phosphomutase [Actinomycetota bacterium]|nr:MSMEG_4193 family putative phosphomutase [Actinomycetota bacterium]
MAILLLVRHGRTTANDSGVLAGRSAGVRLDEVGSDQADAIGRRLASLPLTRLVSSPLVRCRQTLAAIAAHQPASPGPPEPVTDAGITECGYGDWTGQPLKRLARDPLWKTVQNQPSAVTFPGGESMQQMQARAVSAVRRHDADVEQEHGPDALWLAVSHGDVIKSVLADALGLHLDLFQRIVVEPGSVSVVRYTPGRPFVQHLNDRGSDLASLRPPRRRRRRPRGDAPVGGGAGAGTGEDTL